MKLGHFTGWLILGGLIACSATAIRPAPSVGDDGPAAGVAWLAFQSNQTGEVEPCG